MTENLPHRAVLAEKGFVDKVRDYRARCAAAEVWATVYAIDCPQHWGCLTLCKAAADVGSLMTGVGTPGVAETRSRRVADACGVNRPGESGDFLL